MFAEQETYYNAFGNLILLGMFCFLGGLLIEWAFQKPKRRRIKNRSRDRNRDRDRNRGSTHITVSPNRYWSN